MEAVESRSQGWQRLAEVGSLRALQTIGAFHRLAGRRASEALLWPIALYFYLRHARVRAASRGYLQRLAATEEGRRALGGNVGRGTELRHLHAFAVSLLDRMVAWGDSLSSFRVDKQRSLPLLELARAGRGGILVGAHLGSFDLLRLIADEHEVIVNVLMYTAHAEAINTFFERLAPKSRVRILPMDPGAVNTAIAIRACVERGEFVGILADRALGRDATSQVPFLGEPAAFSLAPFRIAATLGCPLLVALCLRTGDARYEAMSIPLPVSGPVPRAERERVALELLAHYVRELEQGCLRAPLQWFNFYDFWAPDGSAPGSRGAPS